MHRGVVSTRSLILALAFAFVPVARAQIDKNTALAKSHLRSGVAYYDEAKYDDAAREIEEAYRLRPLPDLQYNLAQCYERLGREKDAVAAYRKYLAGKPDADDKDDVAARVKNLEARAEKEAAGAPPPPQIVEKEKIVLKEVVVYKEAPPRPGRVARIAALAVGVLAAGALASGITLAVLAKRDADAVSSGGNPADPVPFAGTAAETEAAGKQDRTLSLVSFGAAALLGATAIAAYAYGNSVDRETARIQEAVASGLTIGAGPLAGGGGAIQVGGRF